MGQTLYLRTDTEQYPRMLTSIMVREGYVEYGLSLGEQETYHTEREISTEKNITIDN